MQLTDFLSEQGLTLDAFGALIGVSGVSVWRWKSGRDIPSSQNLIKIREATAGRVTIDDFAPPLAAPKEASA